MGLFLSECEERLYRDQGAALPWAEEAPRLANALALALDRVPAHQRQLSPREWQARAHAVLAFVLYRAGNHSKAERTFRDALRFRRRLRPSVRADVDWRLSYLLLEPGRLDEGLRVANRATEAHECAETLLARGIANGLSGESSLALADFGTVIEMADPKENRRTHTAGLINFGRELAMGSHSSGTLGEAEKHLSRSLRQLRGRSVAKAKVWWGLGDIYCRMGSSLQGERLFKRARAVLLELGTALEVVLITLDMLALYVHEHEPRQVARMVDELAALAPTLECQPAAQMVLKLCETTTREELTIKVIAATRRQLWGIDPSRVPGSSRVAPGPSDRRCQPTRP